MAPRLTQLVVAVLATATHAARCELDPALYNVAAFDDVAVDFPAAVVAPLCGRNRGAFALDPPDGHTYSCVVFPATDGTWGGVNVTDANAIAARYTSGHLSADAALGALDAFVNAVYASTDHQADDPQACEVSGMARLVCDDADGLDELTAADDAWTAKLGGDAKTKIRAVMLARCLSHPRLVSSAHVRDGGMNSA
jgi:hypothetical protein